MVPAFAPAKSSKRIQCLVLILNSIRWRPLATSLMRDLAWDSRCFAFLTSYVAPASGSEPSPADKAFARAAVVRTAGAVGFARGGSVALGLSFFIAAVGFVISAALDFLLGMAFSVAVSLPAGVLTGEGMTGVGAGVVGDTGIGWVTGEAVTGSAWTSFVFFTGFVVTDLDSAMGGMARVSTGRVSLHSRITSSFDKLGLVAGPLG
jgi:hypothetical protein